MATFTLPQTDVQNWQATTTAPILRAFYNATFTAASGIVVPKGSPTNAASAYKSVTTTLLANVVTIPSFTILSTRDGLDNRFALVSFHWYGSDGRYIGPFGSYVNMQVPSLISSSSGCSPSGTCCSFAELYNYTYSAPAIPSDVVYSKIEVDRLVLANIGAGGISGTGASAQVTFFSSTTAVTGDTAATWDTSNKRLNLGTGSVGVATLNVGSDQPNILSLTSQLPVKFGGSHGTNSVPIDSDRPTTSFFRFDRTTGAGNGTTTPYFFGSRIKDGGTKLAIYNVFAYADSEDTNVVPRDAVALVGYAQSQTGSTSRPIGIYSETTLKNNAAGQGGYNEFLVSNMTGVNSPVATGALPDGFTIGLNLTGAGGKFNTIGINFQGGGASAFLTGIHFPSTVIAPGGYGIDFAYATFTTSPGSPNPVPIGTGGYPIRLGNDQYMVGYIGGVDRKLIGLTSTGLVQIDGTSVGSSFGGGIRPGPGGFVASTGQIYTTASQGLVVIGQTGSSYDLLFANAAGTGTLLRNPTGTPHLQLGLSQGDVIVGGNNGALLVGDQNGFLNISSMPGPPVGTPTLWTGYVPLVYDTADNRLYAYNAGWQNIASGGGGGGGSVTSVAVSGANGIGVSGSPITTSGTIALSLGAITPTSVNGLTVSTTTGTLTISNSKVVSHTATTTFAGTDGKILTVSNSLTLAGTDTTTMTFPATNASIARIDAAQTFVGLQTFATILSTTSLTSPIHYGGSLAGSTLSLQGTSNGSPASAHILMNTIAGGAQPGVVGIGAAASSFILGDVLHIQGPDTPTANAFITIDSYGVGAVPAIVGRHANNTAASPTATASGDFLASLAGRGYYVTGGPAFSSSGNAAIQLKAAQDFTSTALGTRITFETTPTGSASRSIKWQIEPDGALLAMIDNTQNIGATSATRPAALFLGAPAITPGSGTGITVNDSGSVRYLTYKVTLSFTALAAAQLTADSVIAVLPAKTRLVSILVDVTTPFTGGAVSAATMTVGKTTGGAEYIASFDCFTAAIRRGLVDADMGTAMTRAAAIQGGDLPSWTATTSVSLRLTTVTAFTNAVTAGSVSIYLSTEQFQ